MRSCLAETIPRTEAELQKTYDLVASVGDAKDKELLEKSQAAWLAYRESECALEGDATRGGSLQLILGAQCWVRLTRQRNSGLGGSRRHGSSALIRRRLSALRTAIMIFLVGFFGE